MKNLTATILRPILRFDRYILKRFFGIETPLYKMWWKKRSIWNQISLDAQQN